MLLEVRMRGKVLQGSPWQPYLGGCTLGWLVGLAVAGAALALRVGARAALGAAVAARVIPGVICSFTVVLGRLRIAAAKGRESKNYPRPKDSLQILALEVIKYSILINIHRKFHRSEQRACGCCPFPKCSVSFAGNI